MGMKGKLSDMAISDLIQHNCQERKTAQLVIDNGMFKAELYFKNGNIVHASLGNMVGEEVVYQVLSWENGNFDLENNIDPPSKTIERSWSSLLLEGVQRLDEKKLEDLEINSELTLQTESNEMPKNWSNLMSKGAKQQENNISYQPDNLTQTTKPEVKKMANPLDSILKDMSNEITGYIASAVVNLDGMNIAQNRKGNVDPEVISSQITLLIHLVNTTITKLDSGIMEENLITTEKAYVIMRFLPDKKHFYYIATDRSMSNLGNIRLVSKLYADQIEKNMPLYPSLMKQ